MTEPNGPVWTLGGDSADTVWAARFGVSVPVVVAIDDDEDVVARPHPDPDATTVRLTPSPYQLTDGVVQELLELLLGIRGVRPPGIPLSAHGEVSVPLLAPSTRADDRVEWTITDQLSLVHADRRDIYFALAEDNLGATACSCVELTPAQTWVLVRALTTIRCWQYELETLYSAAATRRRAALRAAGCLASAADSVPCADSSA